MSVEEDESREDCHREQRGVRMQRSDTIGKLIEALSKAQGAIKGAVKDSENPFFKSHYADLASVWDVCREPFSANGIAVVQFPGWSGDRVTVETLIGHSSGEWMSDVVSAKPAKDDSQSLGSCVSYLRRYALAAVGGIYQIDDDANAATNPTGKPELKAPQAKPATAIYQTPATITVPREPEYEVTEEGEVVEVASVITQEDAGPVITDAQAKRLYAICRSAGFGQEGIRSLLMQQLGVGSTKDVPKSRYEYICTLVQNMGKTP